MSVKTKPASVTPMTNAGDLKFIDFGRAVAAQFQKMLPTGLFKVEIDGDLLWKTYIDSFPEGSNPVYRKATEHECSACRGFVKKMGSVVTLRGSELVTIWDTEIGSFYQPVSDAMAGLVRKTARESGVKDVFLYYEPTIGVLKNREMLEDKFVREWEHFFVNLPKESVVKKDELPTKLGKIRITKEVMQRALSELRPADVQTVLDLIAQNSLYRGEEHKASLLDFQKLQGEFLDIKTEEARGYFCWRRYSGVSGAVAGIRNTSIGSLLVDLAEDKDLEAAVKSFESKVAPENYKRPTALITKAMIEKAKATLEEMGFTSALERRYAVIGDITINNVLFADRGARKEMSVFDKLSERVPDKLPNLDKVEDVSIDDFIKKILPKAESLEVMVENRHRPNFVSLVAPADPTAKHMFKWPNNFTWAYAGELADSEIRKSVQERGGSVTGVFRFSHQWNYDKRNASLMDLHVFMPGSSIEPVDGIDNSYGTGRRVGWNHRGDDFSGAKQDVDYTAAAPVGYVPVENITFPDLEKMPEGRYICKIHNWSLRQPTLGGFRAEIEFDGQVYQYEVDRPLKNHEWVTVAEVTLKKGVFSIKHHLPHGATSREIWGIPTQTFRKVSVVMLSPNHWDGHGVGNRHHFFMLEGCANEGTARGFFNEFLTGELDPHRKVFEAVGAKMKTDESDRQLSGLGFSSTKRDKLTVRVKGSFSRVVNVLF